MEERKEHSLGDIVNLVIDYRGKTPLKLGGSWSQNGYRALSAKNIKTGAIVNEDSIRFVDEELYRRWMKDEVQRGDIFVTSEAPFGQIYYWNSDEKIVLSQRLFCLRLSEEVCSKFVYYYMITNTFQAELDGRATGTTVIGLRQPELLKCKINLPSLAEQQRIASILSSLDEKIEVNRRINDNLEQQAQALFKSWFVDFEPFRDQPFVESELGMIPEGWRVGTLGDYCKVFTGKKDVKQSLSKGLYPFFSCSPNHTYSNEYIYDGASIIIAGNGSYTGRTSFYFGKYDLYQRTYACTIKEGINEKRISFLYYMMKCLFEPVKMGGTRGSSIPYIVMNDIVLQKFVLEDSLVGKYSDFAYSIMKQIQKNNQESRRLAQLRDTLLPRLMSGEIKVNEIKGIDYGY